MRQILPFLDEGKTGVPAGEKRFEIYLRTNIPIPRMASC